MNDITYKEIQIRESMKHEYKELLCINIKYPEFDNAGDFSFINNFYKSFAEKAHEYAKNDYFNDVMRRYESNDDPRKRFRYKAESACINFKITLLNEEFISLYTDLILYANNKIIKRERHSQTWSGNLLYPLDALFRRDKRFRHYGKSDFYLTEQYLILYNKSLEELRIPLDELKTVYGRKIQFQTCAGQQRNCFFDCR